MVSHSVPWGLGGIGIKLNGGGKDSTPVVIRTSTEPVGKCLCDPSYCWGSVLTLGLSGRLQVCAPRGCPSPLCLPCKL